MMMIDHIYVTFAQSPSYKYFLKDFYKKKIDFLFEAHEFFPETLITCRTFLTNELMISFRNNENSKRVHLKIITGNPDEEVIWEILSDMFEFEKYVDPKNLPYETWKLTPK
jgi:hypothetical protein